MTTLFSAAAPFLSAAMAQVRHAFPDAVVTKVESELGAVEGVDLAAVAGACRAGPVTFIRHLAEQVDAVAVGGPGGGEVASAVARVVAERGLRRVALQAWDAGQHGLAVEDVRAATARRLSADGVETLRSGAEVTVGLCLTASDARVCVTPTDLALSDWPGGRIRLARRAERISRSEFKLEELFAMFPIPAGDGRRALDLGASPGGWTRLLRARGYEVDAVDVGELHPSLLSDAGVHVFTTTAGRFLAERAERGEHEWFDVVVNDMRMVPSVSCDLMVSVAPHVAPDGLVITTLKTNPRTAVRDVRGALDVLGRAYEIVFARQLFHNRNEVTVVGRRPVTTR